MGGRFFREWGGCDVGFPFGIMGRAKEWSVWVRYLGHLKLFWVIMRVQAHITALFVGRRAGGKELHFMILSSSD